MDQIISFILNINKEEVPSFFSLLFWTLRANGCTPSSNYIYQDESQQVHEIRYEVISTLTKGVLGPDFSEYIGTYITLKLSYHKTDSNYYEIRVYLESLDHIESLKKTIPWRRSIRRLNKSSATMSIKSVLNKMKTSDELSHDELQIILSNLDDALSNTYKYIKSGPTREYHTGVYFNTH